jgi:HlyD family secretion protein
MMDNNNTEYLDKRNPTPPLGGRGAIGAVNKIELRSEDVQEVLGSVPPWILRWGISLLAGIVLMLIVGSWLFKYPQIVATPMILTTSVPPASLVAKINGKIITLNVLDQQIVKTGECLAILENSAKYDDVISLKSDIEFIREALNQERIYLMNNKNLSLGNLQGSYSGFALNMDSYNQFIALNYYPKKIQTMRRLIESNRSHFKRMLQQKEIIDQQHELNKKAYNRENYLRVQNLISEEQDDKAKNTLLQSDLAVQNMHLNLESMQIQISQMEDNLVDLEQQYVDKKNVLISQLNANINQLESEIRAWEMSYLLISPISGKVTFTNYWTKHQNVSAGDVVFTVIPTAKTELLGKAQLSIGNSGKVKTGQSVNIHFNNYPDSEFGMVLGKVERISLIPTKEGYYVVEISLPKGLVTTYGKELALLQEMTASADIITDDLRLIEQFIQPIKRIIKNNL